MINTHDNVWIPSDGFKYISNGEVWTDSIQLGRTDTISNWHDTNEEPPLPPDPSEEATSSDYESALSELGVSV